MRILTEVSIQEMVEVEVSIDAITESLNAMRDPESTAQANKLINTCHSLIKRIDVTLLTPGSRKIISAALREQADRYEVTP